MRLCVYGYVCVCGIRVGSEIANFLPVFADKIEKDVKRLSGA